jgi:hypothetical protein
VTVHGTGPSVAGPGQRLATRHASRDSSSLVHFCLRHACASAWPPLHNHTGKMNSTTVPAPKSMLSCCSRECGHDRAEIIADTTAHVTRVHCLCRYRPGKVAPAVRMRRRFRHFGIDVCKYYEDQGTRLPAPAHAGRATACPAAPASCRHRHVLVGTGSGCRSCSRTVGRRECAPQWMNHHEWGDCIHVVLPKH